MPATNSVSLLDMANAIRALSMDAVQAAKSGHPGMPMGMADVATVLFTKHLKFVAADGNWADRDRFILSAGHGSMLLYSLLHLTGYNEMTIDELKNFRQLGAKTAGHPEYGHCLGIETTTGPLGQGLANAVGMAMAEQHLAAKFGSELVDHRTYVIAGDGCLMEGISHEAASLAGHLKLNKLIVLFDDNKITIDGATDLSTSDNTLARFAAYGWQVSAIDGHDMAAIDGALNEAQSADRPVLIACRTEIGRGSPNKAGKASAHGSPLGDDEIALTRSAIGWPHAPFEVPDDIVAAWRAAGQRCSAAHQAWTQRLEGSAHATKDSFKAQMRGELPAELGAAMQTYREQLAADKPAWATRKASQEALEVLTRQVPALVGGSADLTGSNNTKTAATEPMNPDNWAGRYIYYGVREHGMLAAMNGMALHGGVIPYGGTFLVFADYCRPAIRLAALMLQQLVFVATHDSIGLGEDGPTHQPIEHLASLRAMPNCLVMRPADAIETAECWEAALNHRHGPSVIALSRQSAPIVRTDVSENLSARGGYVLAEAEGERQVTLIATGTEVTLALEASCVLAKDGIAAAVVSMPCMELFEQQSHAYRAEVLGNKPRLAVEAGSPFGWTRYVENEDKVIGLRGFGASAPAAALYEHFGITVDAISAAVRAAIGH